MLFIRSAAQEDLEQIAAIHHQAWTETYKEIFSPQDLAWGCLEARRQKWAEALRLDPHSHYIATEQGDAVGFFSLVEPDPRDNLPEGTLLLQSIYFAPGQWRKGYGTQCMSFIFSKAREQGYRRLAVWILNDNPTAAAFHQKLGFAHDGAEKEVGEHCRIWERRYVMDL